MRFDVVSLFPEMVLNAAQCGVTGRAIVRGLVELAVWNPRDYTDDIHRTVDDRPYGGGPGMVMKYQPLFEAVQAAKANAESGSVTKVVYLSPQGIPITQSLLGNLEGVSQLVLVAGRYEGIDERFIEACCDVEWSLGDFVLSGGELAALVVIDAVTRLLPGVLGDELSAQQDSYSNGLLDCPHFTRPEEIAGRRVPGVLLSGNHAEIARWRMKQSLIRTKLRRPELLKSLALTVEQQVLLEEFNSEV